MKTPEQYFIDDVRLPEAADAGRELTGAETAFLDKYLGMDRESVLAKTQRLDPRDEDVVADVAPRTPEEEGEPAHSDEAMRSLAEVRLVSFSLMDQEYALPITVIQEVIRFVKPTKLPNAPVSIAGIINLRGRVTPLVSLRTLLGISGEQDDRFIVVCRHRGLQIGLMIGAVSTMYKAVASDLEWNVEGNVGVHTHLLMGLYKSGEKLISILSIDNLVQVVLQGGRTHA